jgi:hypothetical protein
MDFYKQVLSAVLRSSSREIMCKKAGDRGIEPRTAVLETAVMPLN